jgi:hypothetical protein
LIKGDVNRDGKISESEFNLVHVEIMRDKIAQIYREELREIYLMGYHLEEDGTIWEKIITVASYTECN